MELFPLTVVSGQFPDRDNGALRDNSESRAERRPARSPRAVQGQGRAPLRSSLRGQSHDNDPFVG